jgi:hypothetical protein
MSCPFKKMKMTGEAPDNSDKDIRDISHDRQLITQINDESEEKEIEDPISEGNQHFHMLSSHRQVQSEFRIKKQKILEIFMIVLVCGQWVTSSKIMYLQLT